MNLHTQRFFKKQNIDILDTGIKIEKKSLLDSVEYEVPFENIHNKKRIQTITNDNLLVMSFILLVFGLLFLFNSDSIISTIAFIAGTVFLSLALITRKKSVTILTYDGSNIDIPFSHKNKETVLEFSNQIIDASNQFLLKKFSRIDKALPLEGQLGRLEFLRDRNILTDEKYEQLKDQLLGRENKGSVGFGYQ